MKIIVEADRAGRLRTGIRISDRPAEPGPRHSSAGIKPVYLKITVANQDGCDFDLDALQAYGEP